MRFATFNLHHGEPNDRAAESGERVAADGDSKASLDLVAGELAGLNLDVIALQEVDNEKRRSGNVDQAAYLASKLGMAYAYAPSAFGYGVALLSRFPIVRSRFLRLPQPTPPIFRDPEGERGLFGWQVRWPEPRVALFAEVDVYGRTVVVANTHLDIHNMTARKQLQVVADGFAAVERRWGIEPDARFLAGDFNLGPDEVRQALGQEPMSDGAINVARRTGWKAEIPQASNFASQFVSLHEGATYPSSAPEKQIDFVLGDDSYASEGSIEVLSVSDHAAVVISVRI